MKLCDRLFYDHLLSGPKAESRRLRTSTHGKRSSGSSPRSSESALVRQDHVFLGRGNRATRVRFIEDFRAFSRDKLIFCSVLSDRGWHVPLVGLYFFKGYVFHFD